MSAGYSTLRSREWRRDTGPVVLCVHSLAYPVRSSGLSQRDGIERRPWYSTAWAACMGRRTRNFSHSEPAARCEGRPTKGAYTDADQTSPCSMKHGLNEAAISIMCCSLEEKGKDTCGQRNSVKADSLSLFGLSCSSPQR